MVHNSNVAYAFIMTTLAGLATGLGGVLVLLFRKTNVKFLSVALGFSAGVMIYISFAEILSEGMEKLQGALGEKQGFAAGALAFFAGMLFVAFIDRLLPEDRNPHAARRLEEADGRISSSQKSKLLKTAFLTTFAIVLHNFPEGIAAFVSGTVNHSLGAAVAGAVAIHNIPEGVAVAMPVFFATGSRKKALGLSVLSGFAEPLGALIAYLLLYPYITPVVFGLMFAAVAGIMVFISFDELLPTAREYGEHHLSLWGLIAGMAMMAAGIWALK